MDGVKAKSITSEIDSIKEDIENKTLEWDELASKIQKFKTIKTFTILIFKAKIIIGGVRMEDVKLIKPTKEIAQKLDYMICKKIIQIGNVVI